MCFYTHSIFSILLGVIFFEIAGLPLLAFNEKYFLVYSGLVFGAILPDLDHPESKPGKVLWIGKILNLFKFKHRGITHSLLAVSIILIFMSIFTYYNRSLLPAAIAMVVGYFSHLILDMLNKQGVSLLYPKKKRYNILSIKTGGIGGFMVFCLLLTVSILIINL